MPLVANPSQTTSVVQLSAIALLRNLYRMYHRRAQDKPEEEIIYIISKSRTAGVMSK
jgi:hypothetical protein